MFLSFGLPLCLLLASTVVKAQGNFTVPSASDFDKTHIYGQYSIGTNWTISWTTDWAVVDLVLFQDGVSSLQYMPNSRNLNSNVKSYTWEIDLSGKNGNAYFDLKYSNIFSFAVFQSGTTNVFGSQYFNITDNGKAATTLSSSVNVSSAVPSSTSSTTSTSSTSAAPSAMIVAQSNDGISEGTKIGVGVGVGVGVFLILLFVAVGLYIYRDRRRQRAEEVRLMGNWQIPNKMESSEFGMSPLGIGSDVSNSRFSAPSQVPGNQPVGELA